MDEDDVLPPEVRAEVEKVKREEGISEPETEEPARAEVPPERPLSRRQQIEQERVAQIQAANDRAAAAERIATEIREAREKDIERFTRMETLLQESLRHREEAARPAPAPAEDDGAKIAKLRRQATEALTAGKLDEYHELQDEITDIRAESRARKLISELPKPAEAPQQKPAWVSAIESQYPDVLTHANGLNTVAAYAQMDPAQFGPEKLKKAFERARGELGTGKKKESEEENGRRREMLAGGPVNGNGHSPAPRKGEKFVNVPKNYKEIARRAGMSPEDYIRSYAAMNPDEISRE